jgi:hypothetical protein
MRTARQSVDAGREWPCRAGRGPNPCNLNFVCAVMTWTQSVPSSLEVTSAAPAAIVPRGRRHLFPRACLSPWGAAPDRRFGVGPFISLGRQPGSDTAEDITKPLETVWETVSRAGLRHAHKHGETRWKVLHGRIREIRAENGS